MIRSIICTLVALAFGIAVAAPSSAEAHACSAANRTSPACDTLKPAAAAKRGAKAAKKTEKEARSKKPVDPHAPALDATTLACNQEYEDNKAAIDGGGQSKAKFVKDCKNGTETIPGGAKTSAAQPDVTGPPPDKQLPPADPKSGRPIVTKDDQVTGSTKPKR